MSDSDQIAGHHRVAAFLLSLDSEVATKILATMKDDVVAEVAQAMVDLDPRLAGGSIDYLYRDLAKAVNGPARVRPCNTNELTALLSKGFGAKRADEIVQEIQERRLKSRPFLDLEHQPPFALYRVLKDESHAVSALVLAHLSPAASAEILGFSDPEDALEIVRRMATLKPPGSAVLRRIGGELAARVEEAAEDTPEMDPNMRLKSIAELLNFSKPEMEKQVLDKLAEDDPDMANAVREFLFVWEDIGRVDKRSMQKILGTVDTRTLSLSLKSASQAIEDNVMNNLSSRVREMVAEERDLIGSVPVTEVQAARDEIMKNIWAMIEAGEFRPSRAGDEVVS